MSLCRSLLFALALRLDAATGNADFDVSLRMRVSETAEFTKDKVGGAIVKGIAAAVDGVTESMVEITSIGDAPPTPAPTSAPTEDGNATAAPTDAPTPAPTEEAPETTAAPMPAPTPVPAQSENVTAAPTPAPTEDNATVAPTPSPNRRLRSRRLASGEMLVVAAFSGVPDTVTKASIEDKRTDIMAAINAELNGTTVSDLTVAATQALSPTPAPSPTPDGSSGAMISRLDLWIVALGMVCLGRS